MIFFLKKGAENMLITIARNNDTKIAIIHSDNILLSDLQSALDLIATIKYENDCDHIAINKEAISESFFELKTGLAGEILQKFINYKVKFAIIGDFSTYTSRALKSFIYESNTGKDIFFVSSDTEAIEKLASV